MYLTRKEERILNGKEGQITAKALKLLVEMGKNENAEKLVNVDRSHISGVSYKTAGLPMLRLLEDMVEDGVKVVTYATVNPAGMPREGGIGVSREFMQKQKRIISAYEKLGCKMVLTCIPYSTRPPRRGEIVAFAESSAVCYVNSVIGAKTNRHGSLDALAASITGKVPLMGLLLEKNRKPTIKVHSDFTFDSSTEFSLLGLYLGEKLEKNDKPLFSFSKTPNHGELNALGGGLATSGAIGLFHVLGVTPEIKQLSDYDLTTLETITVSKRDFQNFCKKKKTRMENPDIIAMGCPHIPLDRLKKISKKLKGRKLKQSTKLWLFTSKAVLEKAEEDTLASIREAGGKIILDTCPVVAPIGEMNITKVVVNSAKAMSYIPRLSSGVDVSLANIDEIVKRWTMK